MVKGLQKKGEEAIYYVTGTVSKPKFSVSNIVHLFLSLQVDHLIGICRTWKDKLLLNIAILFDISLR